ncbi:hypothetical protein CPB86DRAFT_782988 [Serendipita vermifera]|nr:hypothetical protein CPB86DRAFT_782988 [Serendipita vermifera]
MTNGTFSGDGSTTTPAPVVYDWVAIMQMHINTKQLIAAYVAWLVYEMIITVDQSVELFWKQKWSMSKVLFMLFCKAGPWVTSAGSLVLIIIMNLAMMTRVNALWNKSRLVIYSIRVFFVLHLGSYIGIMSYGHATAIKMPNIPPFTGCFIFPTWDKMYIVFFTALAFEILLIVLNVIRSYPFARQKAIRLPLTTLLFTDGLFYWFVVIFGQIFLIVFMFNPTIPGSTAIIGSAPPIVLTGVSCNRLFIRLQSLLLVDDVEVTEMLADVSGRIFSGNSDKPSDGAHARDYGGRKRRGRGPLSTSFSEINMTEFENKGQSTHQENGDPS